MPQIPGQPRQLAVAVEEVVAESESPQSEHVAKHIFADPREVVVIQSPVDGKSSLLKSILWTSKGRNRLHGFTLMVFLMEVRSLKSSCLFLEYDL
jgi:hypothetical protein